MPDLPLHCVVLHHEGMGLPHYDLLFETAPGSALATWRADRWPVQSGDYTVRTPDHRPLYLSYEGPISSDRGHVRRVFEDAGCEVSIQEAQFEVRFSDGTGLRMTQEGDQWVCQFIPLPLQTEKSVMPVT